jgi:hypothetical protein
MNSDSKKLFTTTQNFALLREKLGEYKRLPTEKETREFLDFWQEMYDLWKQNNSPFESRYTEEKIKIRKMLIEKFGIRS